MIGTGSSFPQFHIVPDSINLIAGTSPDDVADLQVWQDGNLYDLTEAAAAPGQNLEITFIDVVVFRRVVIGMYYDGAANHWVEVRLRDLVAAAWKTFYTFDTGLGLNYRYADIPILSANFIDGTGKVLMDFNHPAMGNVAHNSFIDYAALVR